MRKIVFFVEDVTCDKCVIRIRNSLEKIGRNVIIIPNYKEGRAEINMLTDASKEKIREALKEASKGTKHNYTPIFLDEAGFSCC